MQTLAMESPQLSDSFDEENGENETGFDLEASVVNEGDVG